METKEMLPTSALSGGCGIPLRRFFRFQRKRFLPRRGRSGAAAAPAAPAATAEATLRGGSGTSNPDSDAALNGGTDDVSASGAIPPFPGGGRVCIGGCGGSTGTAAAGALSATAELGPAAYPAAAVDAGSAFILVGSDTADVPPAAFTAFSTAAEAAVACVGFGVASAAVFVLGAGSLSSGLPIMCQRADDATAEFLATPAVFATTHLPSESSGAATVDASLTSSTIANEPSEDGGVIVV